MLRASIARRWQLAVLVVFAAVALVKIYPVSAQQSVPKQVHLVVDGNRLTASNITFSRFDELKLDPRERLLQSEEGGGVIIAVTNQRIIGYGAISAWHAIDRMTNESIESIAAEDFAGLVVTSERLLNFNGETGVWGEHDRAISR